MKHKYLIVVFFFISTLSATAQTPGGVDKPMVWSRDSASVRVSAGAGLTYIGVSKVYGEKEQAIWSLGSGRSITRIQTTERAANLGDGTFMNYAKESLPEMRLYSYTTSSNMSNGQTLHIGRNGNTKLPVKNLDGRTVEYTVFDRRLSDTERCRVESYLALKYDVSLRSSYLNSRNEVIWNGYANKAYSHRIAGLISDRASALHKTRAKSCEEDSFLTIILQMVRVFFGVITMANFLSVRVRLTASGSVDDGWIQRHGLTSLMLILLLMVSSYARCSLLQKVRATILPLILQEQAAFLSKL